MYTTALYFMKHNFPPGKSYVKVATREREKNVCIHKGMKNDNEIYLHC